MGHYHSVSSAIFARITNQRLAAERARHAGRQLAHDSAASSHAAEKRAKKRHEIANRPRGVTEIVGRHEDGRPIYRSIPAFRARPYIAPEQRAARPDRGALPIAGMRSHEETRAAALKAEATQPPTLEERAVAAYSAGDDEIGDDLAKRGAKTWSQRRARKVRAARIRRQGW